MQVGNAAKKQVIAEAIAREEGLTIDTLNDDDWQEAARWYGYDNIDQLKEKYTEQEVKNDLTIQAGDRFIDGDSRCRRECGGTAVKNERILIVEDENDVNRLLATIFIGLSNNKRLFRDGGKALSGFGKI